MVAITFTGKFHVETVEKAHTIDSNRYSISEEHELQIFQTCGTIKMEYHDNNTR
jgi:hypothetical protein